MGNWWSTTQRPTPTPRVRYDVVLPTSCGAWKLLYSGDVDTWDSVAARYGMDKYAYNCGVSNCDRESVCLRYMKASVKSDNQTIVIERYKAPTVHIPIFNSGIKSLLSEKYRLNDVVATERRELALLVLQKTMETYTSYSTFLLVHFGDENKSSGNGKKDVEKSRPLRRLSSKKDKGDGKGETTPRPSSSSSNGRRFLGKSQNGTSKNGRGSEADEGTARPRCMGVFHAPHKDMTIMSCQISPDFSETAILFYSLSRPAGTFCYTLHCYCNLSLQGENSPGQKVGDQFFAGSQQNVEQNTPHLVQTVKLSREVQPYFTYDPRYGASRIAVANYECRDMGIAHELVVLNLHSAREKEEVKVVKRGKLSLPNLFGNSRFNLLYSKDGELIILQKLTDDRFGVTSFCDIYIFNSNDLRLIKYLTASLPGLFHICKVSYEPVFSRCGSFMRVVDYRVANGDSDRDGTDDGMMVQIYQLPRSLSLMSQCRQVILQQVASEQCIDTLPLPCKMKDYLKFGPIF